LVLVVLVKVLVLVVVSEQQETDMTETGEKQRMRDWEMAAYACRGTVKGWQSITDVLTCVMAESGCVNQNLATARDSNAAPGAPCFEHTPHHHTYIIHLTHSALIHPHHTQHHRRDALPS
jgi:hypothetical protein